MAAAGEASTTVLRFFSFIGAGVICTKAINMYLDYERKQEAAAEAEAAAIAASASPSTTAVVAADASPASTVAAAKP
ncbi:signal recognition particle 14 kDa protein-like [Lolium rigidum]|uniref:signal recognition particle 14 kDa protein-like n=1 Tax=Lolium rigidum TaxID=89674 RepID=UPI001F5D1504|nr:signal recognition particle 14 kDa protein-like [Lolium rigidum]